MCRTVNGCNRTEIGMMKSFKICTIQQTVLGWDGQDMLRKWEKVNACKIFFIKQIRDETPWKIMLAWVDNSHGLVLDRAWVSAVKVRILST